MSDLETPAARVLHSLLAETTQPVTATPGTVLRALQGGRARLRRRRAAWVAVPLAGCLLIAVASVSSRRVADHQHADDPATPTYIRPVDPQDPYLKLLNAPGRGDLIGDGQFTKAAIAAWQRAGAGTGERVGRPTGRPRVVWAGSSPAGRTAVVVQRTVLGPADLGSGGEAAASTAIGFIGVDSDGRPTVVGRRVWPGAAGASSEVAQSSAGRSGTQAWFVDPEQTVLGVLDLGVPVGYGTRWSYAGDGTRSMPLTPFTMHDGAGFVRLPLRGPAGDPVRVARIPADRDSANIPIAGQPVQDNPSGTGWGADRPDVLTLTLTDSPSGQDELNTAFIEALSARTTPLARPWGAPLWTAIGSLPGGDGVVLAESRLLPDPARIYAAVITGRPASVGGTRIIDAGPVAPAGRLPRVSVRLPGADGWAVADYGSTLRWRAGAGPWSARRQHAALVPAPATALEVTRPGRSPVVVQLSPGR